MSRAPGLDLLRAIAIAWVMYSHAQLFDLASETDFVANNGWMGVDLFFALSGFLIGGQLFATYARPDVEPQGPWVFYARRLLRTLPAYLAVVGLYFFMPGWSERTHIQPLWQFLTFTENLLFDPSHARAFSHVWSLCVEEQFYLVAPLVVWLMMVRPRLWKAVTLCAGVVLLGVALRWSIWETVLAPLPVDHRGGRWIASIYYPTWNRLDGLLFGMAFAAVRAFRPAWWAALMRRATLLMGAGLAGMALSLWLFVDQRAELPSVIGYPILSLSAALLVASASERGALIGRWRVPGSGVLAAMAYSLYLSHKAAYHLTGLWFGKRLEGQDLLSVVTYTGVILLFGGVLYLGVERPFLKLRDRWLKRSGAVTAEAPDGARAAA